MIKTKMLRESIMATEPEDMLEVRVNNFIKKSKVKIIDIKFAATGNDNRPTALVIYEVEEND